MIKHRCTCEEKMLLNAKKSSNNLIGPCAFFFNQDKNINLVGTNNGGLAAAQMLEQAGY